MYLHLWISFELVSCNNLSLLLFSSSSTTGSAKNVFYRKKKQSIDNSTQRNRIHEKTFTNSNLSKMFYQISTPAWNMPEYGFFLTSIFFCKGRIADFFLYEKMQIRENPWSGVFYSVYLEIFWKVYVKFRRVKDLRLLAPAKKFLDSNVWKNRISKSWKYFIRIKRASLKTKVIKMAMF